MSLVAALNECINVKSCLFHIQDRSCKAIEEQVHAMAGRRSK
jgi:hypothetical protein